jgi:hypothetical protein
VGLYLFSCFKIKVGLDQFLCFKIGLSVYSDPINLQCGIGSEGFIVFNRLQSGIWSGHLSNQTPYSPSFFQVVTEIPTRVYTRRKKNLIKSPKQDTGYLDRNICSTKSLVQTICLKEHPTNSDHLSDEVPPSRVLMGRLSMRTKPPPGLMINGKDVSYQGVHPEKTSLNRAKIQY